jgi:indolepyruvate decarboxylase
MAATILGKSVIGEHHPFYMGVYEGAMGREDVRAYVESSDCLILLGFFMTDINLGIYTARLDPGRSICTTSEKLTIRYHNYEDVRFKDFVRGLIAAKLRKRKLGRIPRPEPSAEFTPAPHRGRITVKRFFQCLNTFLNDDTTVISDVGDALLGAMDLYIRHRAEFLSPAYYTSLGFAVPAAIGAQLANPRRRPLVIVGDGAFQMTGMELSTIARFKLNPIVIVLNNSGYGTERPMTDGPFNDVLPWQYSRIPDLLGAGRGFVVETEQELQEAMTEAERYTGAFSILDVRLDRLDFSPALQRLTQRLAKKVRAKGG